MQDPWYMNVLPDAQHLTPSQLPTGIDSAQSYTSVCINTAIYLPWLASQCLKYGVILKRGIVKHITEAARLHSSGHIADVVVNCTGLGVRDLGGVEDKSVVPARGQIVVVRNEPGEMMAVSGCDDGPDECTYIMQRAAGKSNSTPLSPKSRSHYSFPHPAPWSCTRTLTFPLLTRPTRRRHSPRRLLPKELHRVTTRPQPGNPHNATMHRTLSLVNLSRQRRRLR